MTDNSENAQLPSNEQLIAIEMQPLEGCRQMVVRFNRPFTHVEMNAMHRALNEHLIPHGNETKEQLAKRLIREMVDETPEQLRARLAKDIYDGGQDHHPPGYVGRKGDMVVIHSIQTAVVSHRGTGDGFVVHDGELELRGSQKAKLGASFPKPWTMGGNLVGTHRVGFAPFSYSRIVEVFGEPTETDFSEGSRTAFNWTITFADGTIAAIYEYKRSSLYGDGDDAPTPEEMKRSFTDWHIGGKSQRAVELVNKALSAGE